MTHTGELLDGFADADAFVKGLRARIEKARSTQGELAEESGVLPENLSKYLNNRRTPQLRTMLRLDAAMSRIEGSADAG